MLNRIKVIQKLEGLKNRIGGTVKTTKKFRTPYLALADIYATVVWLWDDKQWLVFLDDKEKRRLNTIEEVVEYLQVKDSTNADQ